MRRRISRRRDKTTTADKVRKETRFRQSPERVWRALTEANQLRKWLLPSSGDIAPVTGHRFHFDAPDGSGRIACEVVEAVPNKRLTYTWQTAPDQPATRVTWTLEPDTASGGTRLHLEHDAAPAGLPALFLTGFLPTVTARLRFCLSESEPRRRISSHRRLNTYRKNRTIGVPLCL
jgi:uncharacterized protein YndB with AHSA1/START domain